MSLAMMQFDDRLFQRGLTWQECKASWEPNRESFLEDVAQAPDLPKLKKLLGHLNDGRLVLAYRPNLLDAVRTLPILGHALDDLPQLTVRYFSMDHFFPLLYPVFGRTVPCLALLDEDGRPTETWGPRPQTLTEAWHAKSDLSAPERDAWLWSIEPEDYAAALDASLAESLKEAVHQRLTDTPTAPL